MNCLPSPSELPSVALENRSELPAVSGVYIAVGGDGRPLYVGQAINLRSRWERLKHHRTGQLLKVEGVRLHWVEAPPSALNALENDLILALEPPLNRTEVPFESQVEVVEFFVTEEELLDDERAVQQALDVMAAMRAGV